MREHRIVALVPSATEIVASLGFADRLVGRSHACDYPPSVQQVPVCSEPRFDVVGTSRQIDERVRNALRGQHAIYRVFSDTLEELEPTLIVTQRQCQICAVSLKDVEEAVAHMSGPKPNVVPLGAHTLSDVWDDIRRVGVALNAPDRAESLVAELQKRLHTLAERTASLTDRPRVACIEWTDPLMAAGNWVPELVESAGGENLFGETGRPSPWITWEQLVEADPDVIAVMPCGFDVDRIRQETAPLLDRPEWPDLKAVQDDRVFLIDGKQYFNRPGPRLVESAELLAQLLHPGEFNFDHEETSWQHL